MSSRFRTAAAAAAGAVWLVACSAAAGFAAPPLYKPGEVIVRFRDSVTPSRRLAILQDLGSTNSKRLGTPAVERLRINKRSVDEAIARYQNDPDVVYIQPNHLLYALVTPSDSLFSQQWALQNLGQTGGTPGADIRATAAWAVSTGSSGVLVGVIDTGVDYNHPDLAANMYVNPGEIPGNGLDDDANGYVDDVRGWDFVNDDNDPMDDVGHGTHVAGTIGAVGNNLLGVAGVCWDVTLMPLKFLSPFGGTSADAVEAVRYATRMGVRLTSNSWGGGGFDQALYEAIAEARDAGIVFVAAAGNASSDTDLFPNYPSAYDLSNIVAVAATDHNDQLAGFSNFGATTVDLAAPGVDVLSTVPFGGYSYLSGTSMATPHVSGVLALFFSRFPAASGLSAKSAVLARATPLPSLAGRVLTGARLDALLPIADPDSTAPAPILDLRVAGVGGQFVALAWSASGDDGSVGTANAYDLRAATYPLDASNVDAAPRYPGPPSPLPSGGAERDTVRDLAFGTTHYFAVRALDEFGNLGPISNVVSATTAPPPDIDVQPTSISATLLTGQSTERTVTISNSGPSDLEFELRARTTAPGASLKWRSFQTTSRRTDDPAPEPPAAGPAATYRPASAVGRPLAEFARTRVANVQAGPPLRLALLASGAGLSTLRSQLLAFPDVESADILDVSGTVPALATLAEYDAVILSVNVAPADRNGLGNVLADYADGGGGVILTLASFITGWNVAGRLLNEGYVPFTIGTGPGGGSSLGTFDVAHPIMQDVTSAAGDLLGIIDVAPGAESVARWANNLPFVATQGTSVVGVNAFLADPGFWSGDVPLILHNAALWSRGGGRWLSGEPRTGVVASGGSAVVTARLDATGLFGGPYDGTLEVHSNDPDEPVVGVAAHLDVIGAPDLSVVVPPVTFVSVQTYATDSAVTTHSIAVDVDPSAGGSITLVAEGDFGNPGEFATLSVEGTVIGSVGANGTDCTPATGSFPVTLEQLTAWLADGQVDAVVENTLDVNPFCSANRHVVTLNLPRPTDPLEFGSVFVGNERSVDLAVRNDGTQDLIIAAVTTDRPEFHLSFTSGVVPPRTTHTLRVTFQPTSPSRVTATLHLLSDDADTPDYALALAGDGILPPDVAVDPTTLAVTLPEGGSTNRTLHLSNVGASDLTFAIDVRATAGLPEPTAFAGLSPGAASASSSGEPRFRVTSTVVQPLASSPTAITALSDDPVGGLVYGQQLGGNRFFRYVAADDRWEDLVPSPTFAGSPGAGVVLNGRVYLAFAYQPGISVYDLATNSWSRIDSLGYTTGITSDGSYLYLIQYDWLFRYDPATSELRSLARAPFGFNVICGLRHFEGRVYGFVGSGDTRTAVYDVGADSWRTLPAAPIAPLVGITIDPIRRSLVVNGPYGGNNVAYLGLDDERWTVGTLPLFIQGYGGIGWLPGPVPGLLVAQGDFGSGFARIVDRPDFVTVTPASGRVAPGATLDLDVRFTAGALLGGTYHALLAIASNDPDEPELSIPADLTVIGTPNLGLAGEAVSVASVQPFFGSGATTVHALALPVVPGGSGVLALDYDGDFGDGSETALVVVEGVGVGTAPALGTDCSSGHAEFPVSIADLEAWGADGVVNVSVVNAPPVDAFCVSNQHRVTLHYPATAEAVDFGEVFVGVVAEHVLQVSNRGSAPLVIESIVTDRPEFTVSSSSLTLPARTSVSLTLGFAPVVPAALSATLTVTSNDPDQPVVTLPLTGIGVEPPVASIDPTAFIESLGEGETVQRALTLSNTGGGTLTFDVQLFVPAPGGDSIGFSGLSRDSAGASNNPAPSYGGPAEGAPAAAEPRFHAATGEVLRLASSPVPLTCVVADDEHGAIYAQENQGTRFYRYDAVGDRWDPLSSSPIYSGNNGGAALLRGVVYTSYTEQGTLGVYSIAGNSWSLMSSPLPYGTGVMTSDDDRYLYLAVGYTLVRWDVETGLTRTLPIPPFYVEPWGGIEFFEGFLYVHTGNGTVGFARFDVATEQWSLLPSVPGGAVLGSAVDPGTREYVAYGSYGGNNLYRYSLDHGTWGVSTLPLFSVFDGGMGYLSGGRPGVYMVQGEAGIGFGVLLGQPSFIAVDPLFGTVSAGGEQSLAVTLGDPQLRPGIYASRFAIRTNDPLHPRIEVPVTLEVRTVPSILLTGSQVRVESRQTFSGPGAVTSHTLTPTGPVGSPAAFSLRADGDYADPGELALLTVEGVFLGTVGGVGADCVPAIDQFGVPDSLLANFLADGQIQAQVQNSFAVDPFCPANQHTVALTFYDGIDPMDFGEVFLGATRARPVVVHNVGTAPLHVERAEFAGAAFTSPTDSLTVPPGGEASIEVRFSPTELGTATGTMTVRSNDPRRPALVVPLRGVGVTPPEIAVAPVTLHTRLGPELARDLSVRIDNPGGQPLTWTIHRADSASSAGAVLATRVEASSRPPRENRLEGSEATTETTSEADVAPATADPVGGRATQAAPDHAIMEPASSPDAVTSDPTLNDLVLGLAARYEEVTSVIPDRYDFSEGEIGSSIVDGGNNMYDGGNRLFTNLGGPVSYSNTVPRLSSVFGSGGRYFTRKFPGLFVLAADVNNVGELVVDGNLGANGLGSVAASVLLSAGFDRQWIAFSKRVFGAGVPSVNHLIVVEDGPGLAHNYATYTDSDFHGVLGLNAHRRLYYLLYSGRAGAPMTDEETQRILERFLDIVDPTRRWLSASPSSGVLPGGQSQDVTIHFDTHGLTAGDYEGALVVESNAPAMPEVTIAATLNVVSTPVIEVVPDSLDFPNAFVGFPTSRTLTVLSLGGAPLEVTGFATGNADLTAAPASLTLAPGTSGPVDVTFTPTSPGTLAATLQVASNDPSTPQVPVLVTGSAVIPPQATFEPQAVDELVSAGFRRRVPMRLCNTGGWPLTFSMMADSTSWLSMQGPRTGELAPGGCVDDTLTLDATSLAPGFYTSTLRLYSSDPDETEIVVDVRLRVVPAITAILELDPNGINPAAGGRWVTAFVELPSPHRVEDIQISTALAIGTVAADGSVHAIGDADGDGVPDLMLKFDRGAVVRALPALDRVEIVVTGELADGRGFVGRDSARLVRPRLAWPNGGEVLTAGSTVTLRWDWPPDWQVTRAEIDVSVDGGSRWEPLTVSATGTSLAWVVPGVNTVGARLRLRLYDADGLLGVDDGDGAFSIVDPVSDAGPAASEGVAMALWGGVPNPFLGSTRIRYAVPAARRVRLEVFDLSGRRCRVLAHGDIAPGRHEVAWDGRDDAGRRVSAGVYVIRLEAGSEVMTRRVARIE